MTTEAASVECTVAEGIATIILNRPDARNGMNQEVADALYDIAIRLTHDKSVRAVLIEGRGPVFSVGGDVGVFASTAVEALPETLSRMAARYHDALGHFARLEVPVVCAVHGAVAGGALGLLYISDIVIASEKTKFALGFGSIGLTGDGGTSWFLPRLIGVRRAAELYFEDRVLDATEAAEWGLITRVVSAEDLTDNAASIARRLASGPTRAYGTMRTLFRRSATAERDAHLAEETAAVGRIAATFDATRAFRSFVTKQAPEFEGR